MHKTHCDLGSRVARKTKLGGAPHPSRATTFPGGTSRRQAAKHLAFALGAVRPATNGVLFFVFIFADHAGQGKNTTRHVFFCVVQANRSFFKWSRNCPAQGFAKIGRKICLQLATERERQEPPRGHRVALKIFGFRAPI